MQVSSETRQGYFQRTQATIRSCPNRVFRLSVQEAQQNWPGLAPYCSMTQDRKKSRYDVCLMYADDRENRQGYREVVACSLICSF
jgi:hypothetical protein